MGYRVALIILYDSEKKILLQHRSNDAKLLPGYWAFFGGEIKQGETPEEAVCREAFEELNYKINSPELVLEQDFIEGSATGHIYLYIEAINDGAKSALKLQEGQGWGWYNESEINELKMLKRDRQIISSIMSYLKNRERV